MNELWKRLITLLRFGFVGLLTLHPIRGDNSNPHRPWKWTIIRLEDGKTLTTWEGSGNPSLQVAFCKFFGHTNPNNLDNWNCQHAIYMCPASNPGKEYCNSPNQYYCAYWGCETVATHWTVDSLDPDIRVSYSPWGCTPPVVTATSKIPTPKGPKRCEGIFINVTTPEDPGWLIGKTWGYRIWTSGTDYGSLLLIKKELVPKKSIRIGPNPALIKNPPGLTNHPKT